MTGLSPDFPLYSATYINCWVSTGPSLNITKGFKSLALQQQKNYKVYQWLPTLLSYLQTKRGLITFWFCRSFSSMGGQIKEDQFGVKLPSPVRLHYVLYPTFSLINTIIFH